MSTNEVKTTPETRTTTEATTMSGDTQSLLKRFDMDELLNCMHCGFCLPTCPTYQQTGLENQSPRGRIGLMKGVAEGTLPLSDEFEADMYACLGCRACETACPAGVEYGHLIETAREVVTLSHRDAGGDSALRAFIFDEVFMYPNRVRELGIMVWFLQATGLQWFANQTGLAKILPRPIREMQRAVPMLTPPWERAKRRSFTEETSISPSRTVSSRTIPTCTIPTRPSRGKPRVGLLTGCVMDVMFYETNQSTARVLLKAGCEVVFVEEQNCCGALHAHSGEKQSAVSLAKRNIKAFEEAEVDFVVNNAGGCGAALREYDHWLAEEEGWRERSRSFVRKVRDISELLAELPALSFTREVHARVTYQDSCHLRHGQGVSSEPREIIRRIPGVEFVELPHADSCCGSAGIYNVTNFDMSMQVLDQKMQHVQTTHPDIIVTSNPGCLLQMRMGIVRAGLEESVKAVHIVDLLDMAL